MKGGQLTAREAEIIHQLLIEHRISVYEIFQVTPEGHDLPGSTYESEIEWVSGTIVTPTAAYNFWLDWVDGHYSLGDEEGFWREVDLEEDIDKEKILTIQQSLQQKSTLPIARRNIWPAGLQDALKHVFTASFQMQWGYNIGHNYEFYSKLKLRLQDFPEDSLRILSESIDQHGIIFQLAAGKALTSLGEVTNTIFSLLAELHEKIFVFFPMHTDGVLQYWFAIGKPSHGHIGIIRINLEDAPYLEDLSDLDFAVPGMP